MGTRTLWWILRDSLLVLFLRYFRSLLACIRKRFCRRLYSRFSLGRLRRLGGIVGFGGRGVWRERFCMGVRKSLLRPLLRTFINCFFSGVLAVLLLTQIANCAISIFQAIDTMAFLGVANLTLWGAALVTLADQRFKGTNPQLTALPCQTVVVSEAFEAFLRLEITNLSCRALLAGVACRDLKATMATAFLTGGTILVSEAINTPSSRIEANLLCRGAIFVTLALWETSSLGLTVLS